jgi:hypothetical protein
MELGLSEDTLVEASPLDESDQDDEDDSAEDEDDA